MPRAALIDPLAAAPYKIPKRADIALKAWLRSHAWPIRIVPMTLDHARSWDMQVQPTVERIEFERMTGLRVDEPARADAYWNFTWSQIWRLFTAARRMPVRASGRGGVLSKAHLLAIEAGTADGPKPVGMLLGLTLFPLPEPTAPATPRIEFGGQPANAVFAWQLTAAPGDVLVGLGVSPNLALGRVLVDTVVQVSLAAGHFGHVLLHADPRGGPELLNFYAGCEMQRLDEHAFPSISSGRDNDGRYFYFTPPYAGAFARTYSHLRESLIGALSTGTGPIRV